MYTINEQKGTVTRDIDNVVVAPTNNPLSADYLGYLSWVALGNSPTIEPLIESSSRVLNLYEFRDRFTLEELGAVLAFAYSGDAMCRLLLLKLQTASAGIDLNDLEVIGGVQYLVTLGVLTTARSQEILT